MQRLLGGLKAVPGRGPAPVHLWNPAYCGELDMKIRADGAWYYNGSVIGRPALVRLFSTILRRDRERFVLVTPVERVGIEVEDAPFMAVDMTTEASEAGERLIFRTNVDDIVVAGRENPVFFAQGADGALKPYIHVRAGLWALATRALAHDLVARSEIRAANFDIDFASNPHGSGSIAVWKFMSNSTSPPSPDAASVWPAARMFGLTSGAAFFPICPAADIEGAA